MKSVGYLFDTHALLFWCNKTAVSSQFIQFFDEQNLQGALYLSSISFWEIALLVQKGRLALSDVHGWKDELLRHTNVRLLEPSVAEMTDSTLLPPHHKDPFDRILIAQALQHGLIFVTQDQAIQQYDVPQLWL
jgi:PIN domain nuclease of toxin-antitoxin system